MMKARIMSPPTGEHKPEVNVSVTSISQHTSAQKADKHQCAVDCL